MADYLKLVPGVTFAEQGIDEGIPIIRGIATGQTAVFTPLTTGIYLDDMPFQDLFAPISVPNLHPFDLERVEVLKGPQGTLFGSGALAGAVRYIVQKPVLGEWGGKLQHTTSWVSEGSSSSTWAGAINVPIGERAALRAMGLTRNTGGIYDVRVEDSQGNVIRDDRDVDAAEQDSFRLLGGWDVTDRLSLSAMHFTQESTQDDFFSYADQRERPERANNPFASPRESSFGGTNLTARYARDSFDLFYSGNLLKKDTWQTLHQETALGIGNQNAVEAPNTVAGDVDGLTNELRVSSRPGSAGPWTWLFGVSRLDYDQFIFQFFKAGAASGGPSPPPRRVSDVSEEEKLSSLLFATLDTTAFENALFGEVTRRIGERWEATVGLRAYKTELRSDTLLAGGQVPALFPGETEHAESFLVEDDGVNPKFSLRFLLSENLQLYALAAKGFQFGGIQLNPPSPVFITSAEAAGFSFGPYDSSTLWNYELGMRSEWFDERLRFDLTLFYLDWTDLQLNIVVPVVPQTPATPPVGFNLIGNVGAAHSQGLEVAVDWVPWDFLQLTSRASFMDAVTDEAFDEDNPEGPVPPGSQLPGAPKFQISNVVGLTSGLPFTRSWDGTLTFTHTHMGHAPDNIRKLETIGGYDTFDVRFILAHEGVGLWPGRLPDLMPGLTLGVTNVTDERGVSAQLATTDAFRAFSFVQPRTVGLTLDLQF